MEKNRLKRLKKLSRSELLEIMLALKRENDILMMDNVRLKTIKHKLENEIKKITDTLERIERSTYETDSSDEIAQDGAQQEYNAFKDPPTEEYDGQPFEDVPDSHINEVANK